MLVGTKNDQRTFNTELAAIEPAVAVMTAEPVASAVATPLLATVATAVFPDDQMLYVEMSKLALEQVAVAT